MNKPVKKILVSPWTAIITLSLIIAVRVFDPSFVQSVRLRYFDTLIANKEQVQTGIITANIDEATINKYGQFPFPRDVYAKIVNELYERNAGLVVFNILMSEPDRFGKDDILASTISSRQTVILPSRPDSITKNTPRAPGSAIIGTESEGTIVRYPGIIANIPKLENAAAGIGTTHTEAEIDGVNRRIPLVVSVDGKIYPGLALETLRVATGNDTFQVKLNDLGVEKLRLPGDIGIIETDSRGSIWIDFSQKSVSMSLVDLPKDLQGSIVVVGVTAAGIGNPVPTSIGPIWPHELQSAVITTIASKTVIQRPSWADGAELLGVLALAIILLILTRWIYVGLASVVLINIGIYFGSILAFTENLWLVDASWPIVAIVVVALHAYGIKFISEFLQKQQIKKQFGTYLSPDLVAQLQRQPELLQLGGDSRELSIMFTDVRGFTSISEHYGKDVQGLTKIMNRYMTAMTKKILENHGTLDKYIGDAQMAFWNAPLDNKQHAIDAVRTGLQMLESLNEFNKEVTAEGVPAFGMGLGINTDTVVVGNMGSDQRFDYTCLGDGVNLASRLEGQSKPYHVAMVIGPKTHEYVKDEYYCLELDCLAVKGKHEGVNVYTVLGRIDELKIPLSDTQMHAAMLHLYRNQNFVRAITFCKDLKGRFNGAMDGYYDMWIERCEEMKDAGLPKDWDGVFRTNTK